MIMKVLSVLFVAVATVAQPAFLVAVLERLDTYLEKYEADASLHDIPTQEALGELIQIAEQVAQIRERTGRSEPTVVT